MTTDNPVARTSEMERSYYTVNMTCRALMCCLGTTLAFLGLSGCVSEPFASQGDYNHTTAPIIPDHTADIPRINMAVLQKQHILIHYQVDGERPQAIVTVEPITDDPSSTSSKTLPVKTLRGIPEDSWQHLQDDAIPIVVRGAKAWHSLLYASLHELTPEMRGYGACVDILQQHELFLYLDENKMLVSVPLVFKPADVKIARSYEFAQLLEIMAQQLRIHNPVGEHFLFETGDDSEYGYPFVYADKHTGLILFLQSKPWDRENAATLPLGTTLEMFTRTIIDHIQAVFNQPVTSIARLFTMVSVSTADLARPTPLTLVKYDPIPPLNTGESMDLMQWETRLDNITGTSPSSGRLNYLIDGSKFFQE